MASANVLSGLYKWLDREEWQEPFQEMLHQHLAEPCEAAGIPLDGLAGVIGDHHVTVLGASRHPIWKTAATSLTITLSDAAGGRAQPTSDT